MNHTAEKGQEAQKTAIETVGKVKALIAYECLEERWIDELNSQALICRHR